MASAIKTRPLFLAWGSGRTWWDATIQQQKTFVADALATDYPNLDSLVVASLDGLTEYVVGRDYTVDADTGIVKRVPAGTIPAGAQVTVTYVPHREAEDVDATSLITPLGFRPVTETDFVFEDPANGTIQLTSGRYSISNTATPELYTRTSYDYEDGSGSTIRELALYMDCQVAGGLPQGQQYFTPLQMASQGIMVAVQHIPPLTRTDAIKQTFEFVLVV